jgi:hypothetical protein
MNNTKCTFTNVENWIKDHPMSIMEIAQLVPVLAILTPTQIELLVDLGEDKWHKKICNC